MTGQLHVSDNLRQQRARRVRQRGAAETRREFFSNGSAAGLWTALQNQWLEARLGQVKRRHQPVVAAANDNNITSLGHPLAGPRGTGRSPGLRAVGCLHVLQYFKGSKASGSAHNAAAGM